ncbi:imine reductase family protein, partial [Streptomyces rimosus]
SDAAGINTELPKLIKAMADRAMAAGHGGEQYPMLIGEFMHLAVAVTKVHTMAGYRT